MGKSSFLALNHKILVIRRRPQGKKCAEFFCGQNGVEISAEISTGAEISAKNRFLVEYSAPAEISTPF